MGATILYGKELASFIKRRTERKAKNIEEKYGETPGLAVIVIGDNPASATYVANKEKACLETGIHSEVVKFPNDVDKEEVIDKIYKLNHDTTIHGILVQLPLPKHLEKYEGEILEAIDPIKDVDGFHYVNAGKLFKGYPIMVPCTPLGCLFMLNTRGIEIEGKHAVIVGRSNIVGKPMAQLLLTKNATVTICHSHTKNLADITRQADILIVAIGQPKFITADMVKEGAVVIDVGINRLTNNKLVGDVDFDNVKEVASAITPVPGGVGLLTVAMLMRNTVLATELQVGLRE
jgi:methylenetetrahydrofolate dehydrogenase (NADP+)/methenyltetrahydrofolate cyclohydrolase